MTLEKQSLRTPITKNDKKTVNLVQQTKAELKEFIPFQGARGYCSFEYEDDCLDVTIKDHQLTIRDLYDEGVICEGIIVHGKVLNAEGKELEVMLKPFELKLKRDGKWITFHELKRPDVE